MASVIVVVAAAAFSSAAVATNEALSMALSSSASLASMKRHFVRSEEEHSQSMASIFRRMNTFSAMQVLEQHEQASPALLQMARRAFTTQASGKTKTFLGAAQAPDLTGYGGFAPALKLLNSMVYESMKKYDTEAAKCTDYYSKQCGMLEGIRGEISTSNYKAATCREHTLAAQSQISQSEDGIPTMKQELKQNTLKCKHEIHELHKRMKVVLGDISVLTKILEMTECSKKSMMQVDLLHCKSKCTDKGFKAVDHADLQHSLSQLQSNVAVGLVQQSFSDLADSEGSEQGESDLDDNQEADDNPNQLNRTKPAAPRTEVPDSPCNDPYQGAPSPTDKRAAKCTVSASPQCTKIQERFLLIQSGIQDERDDLQEEIAKMDSQCESTHNNMESQLKDEAQHLNDQQTKLAEAMECEAQASEQGRLGNKEHAEASADLKGMMKTCSTNYQNFETEICGLKKIRGELYKMRGTGKQGFFQDCVLSPWEPQECSKKCGGGIQRLTRSVTTAPKGGTKCLPLMQMKSCKDAPCPVDCRMEPWESWSRCSAECGGGVMQRLREVKRQMKYNGKPCGESSQTKACNVQSCESDCELSDWSAWSKCSKECDGGTRKRQKFITQKSTGQGSCAGMWDSERLDYKDCNKHRCVLKSKATTLTCKAKLDVILVLDGSGSLGRQGWIASKRAAATFVSAFEDKDTEARMSVILFSGPKTWGGVRKCFARNGKPVDLEKDCSIKLVDHFTNDLAKLKSEVAMLKWPKGSTLTSLALGAARSELNLGRKDAKSVVVVITDGRPMSFRKTNFAARTLRKAARLMWVPVTRFAPLRQIRKWATRRWEENVITVKDFKKLQEPEVVSKMIADLCPP